MGGEGPGQQLAHQTRKDTRYTHTHTHSPHPQLPSPLPRPTHSTERASQAQAREMAVQALGEPRALARGRKWQGKGGRAGDGVALRATLPLRARMTEQADIRATGNKSPRQHSGLLVPCGWCPRAIAVPGQSSTSVLPSPPLSGRDDGVPAGVLGATSSPGSTLTYRFLSLLFSLPVPEFHPPQPVLEQVLHQSAPGEGRARQGGLLAH